MPNQNIVPNEYFCLNLHYKYEIAIEWPKPRKSNGQFDLHGFGYIGNRNMGHKLSLHNFDYVSLLEVIRAIISLIWIWSFLLECFRVFFENT